MSINYFAKIQIYRNMNNLQDAGVSSTGWVLKPQSGTLTAYCDVLLKACCDALGVHWGAPRACCDVLLEALGAFCLLAANSAALRANSDVLSLLGTCSEMLEAANGDVPGTCSDVRVANGEGPCHLVDGGLPVSIVTCFLVFLSFRLRTKHSAR